MLRIASALLFAFIASSAAACGSPFGPEPVASMANKLLHAKKFAELDAMAAKYRKEPVYDPEGQPAILMMYDGLTKQSDKCSRVVSTQKEWEEQGKLLAAWRAAAPKSVTARIAVGSYQRAQAWFVRGGGYASSVGEQQWVDFRAGMARAKKTLESTVPAADRDAGWYDAMLGIGLAQQWPVEEFNALSDAATKRYPGYLPLYVTGSYYHSAQWYGSDEAFIRYVEQAVERTRETLGETLYTRLHHANRSGQMYTSGRTSWARMKAGWERITNDFPVAHNRNNFAVHACENQDAPALKQQFDLIGEQLMLANWPSKQMLTYCQHAQHGPTECFKREDNGELICRPAKAQANGA